MPTIKSIQNAATGLAKKYGIKNVRLFGSYADGTQNANSDIDLLVEFPESSSYFDIYDFQFKMEQLTGKKVDVIPAPVPERSLLQINKEIMLYGSI